MTEDQKTDVELDEANRLYKLEVEERIKEVKERERKHRRYKIATASLQGILCNHSLMRAIRDRLMKEGFEDKTEVVKLGIAKVAVCYADALLEALVETRV